MVVFTLFFAVTCNVRGAEVVHVGTQIVGGSDGARLSADGSTVVGILDSNPASQGNGPPFVWTRDRGLQPLGPFPGGQQFETRGISADGSTIVGNYGPQQAEACIAPYEGYTWNENGGVTLLPHPENVFSVRARFISDDGGTIVGHTISDVTGCVFSPTVQEYKNTAFRWTEPGGFTLLDLPDNRIHSYATDVSADGSIVVGIATSGVLNDPYDPVIWNDEGVHKLGPIPDEWRGAGASYVSADGKTVVGASCGVACVSDEWFRWTDADGLMELPKLSPDQRGLPLAVSDDGSVILGVFFKSNNELTSVVWDEQYGTRDLWDVLIDEHGMTREELGDLNAAVSLSADTKTLLAFEWSPNDPQRYSYDVIYLDKPLVSPRGDFDGSHYRDAADIDLLSQAIGGLDLRFDLNSDQIIDESDRRFWMHNLVHTYYGDANLDGEFNSSDFIDVFLAGEYEDTIDDNSGWAEGDWDGDADFTSQDMIAAFLDGGYEQGPRGAVRAVPEPGSAWLLLVSALLLVPRAKPVTRDLA